MKIVYLGYDILLQCLEAVRAQGHQILKIYTIPPGGVYDTSKSIIALAAAGAIPITTRRFGESDIQSLLELGCELLICAGYPYKLPVDTRLPAINIHPSLLPQGRGAWPLPAMILRGLKRGGVTIHKLSGEYDAGDILLQQAFPLARDETLITLTGKIQTCATKLLVQCLQHFAPLYARARPQDPAQAEYWPDPAEADQTVSLDLDTARTDSIVRAFAGYGCYLKTARGRLSMDIPTFRKIRLSDRERVRRICADHGNALSAYAFATMYCWRDLADLQLYMEQSWFVVRSKKNDYYYPCGDADRTEVFLRMLLHHGQTFRLGYITEKQKIQLEQTHPEFIITEARDNFDYIVPMKQIAGLGGKHFQTARKEVHQFERSGLLEWENMTPENVHIVEELAGKWSAAVAKGEDYADTCAERNAVRHFARLDMQGILTKKDGAYFGFVMGSGCSKDTIDVHFSKCCDKSPGADFYCKQKFCARYMDEYTYMNMEEDMGVDGLRTRKLLYHPSELIKLYIAEYTGE